MNYVNLQLHKCKYWIKKFKKNNKHCMNYLRAKMLTDVMMPPTLSHMSTSIWWCRQHYHIWEHITLAAKFPDIHTTVKKRDAAHNNVKWQVCQHKQPSVFNIKRQLVKAATEWHSFSYPPLPAPALSLQTELTTQAANVNTQKHLSPFIKIPKISIWIQIIVLI